MKTQKTEKQRTLLQNRALHLYFTHLAEELNGAGLEMKAVLAAKDVDVPWTGATIKEVVWKPVMEAQLGKKSTTEMTSKDIDSVFETLTRHLAQKFDLVVDFPNIDKFMLEKLDG